MAIRIQNKLSWGKDPFQDFIKIIKIWHLHGALGFGRFELSVIKGRSTKEQWHKSKVKHLIRDDLIMYAKVTWARVVKLVKNNAYSNEALLKGFDQIWGARNVLCRWDRMKVTWDWKHQHM